MTKATTLSNSRENTLGSRRLAERRRVLWGSRIAHLDGSRYTKCETRDISVAGVRIFLEDQQYVCDRLYFLDMRNRLAYEARVIWQKSPEMGLQFLRSYRFDEVPSPELRKRLQDEG
ncbi:MAG: hypothetical protein RL274_1208 [Pseudomonadota bacterium]|jgi:hypothetical protein